MIKFYFHQTPNPMKVALFLEEAGLEYEIVPVDIFKAEQHTPEYRAVNPNGKVPAIEDGGDVVFDSNAILMYLSEKYGKFGAAPELRSEFLAWYMFIATGIGPYSGQCVHFTHAHQDSPYAANRYRREVQRHYGILNDRLEGRDFIVGDSMTIADIAGWGWVDKANFVLNTEDALTEWPNLKRWFDLMNGREAVARARAIPKGIDFKTDFDEETLRSMFPQNF